MSWRGGIAVACMICTWLAPGVHAAAGARSVGLGGPRVAAVFADIIRRDAEEQIRRSKTAVTVTDRCCGVRVLLVRYRARATGNIKQGAYVLSLETERGVVRGVAISESATEVGYRSSTARWENRWNFELAVRRESHGAKDRWSFKDSYSNVSRVEDGLAGAPSGAGFAQECRLPAPVPSVLYREGLLMLEAARRHVPSTPGLLPLSACQPGGRGAG